MPNLMPTSGRVLVIDDDPTIVGLVQLNLDLEGHEVFGAGSGGEGFHRAAKEQPDLILLDVMMPGLDGFAVCRMLREDVRTSHIPIIMLTAKGQSSDKVAGLTAGADDYILKPFDPSELAARVKTTLRRAGQMRAISPLTGLPGNGEIEAEVSRRLGADLPVAMAYVDIDFFKPFNDRYGFARGDRAILHLATLLRGVASATTAFVGHIGGDDFVIVATPEEAEPICRDLINRFDTSVTSHYDRDDAERGWIEVRGRRGPMARYPLLTLSIGIACSTPSHGMDYLALVDAVSEMKACAKRSKQSAFAVDRRSMDKAVGDRGGKPSLPTS